VGRARRRVGLSLTTKLTAGSTGQPLDHHEVLEAGQRRTTRMGQFLGGPVAPRRGHTGQRVCPAARSSESTSSGSARARLGLGSAASTTSRT
jgi:hypothetical protein